MTETTKPLSRFVRRVSVSFALLFVLTWVNGIFAVAQLGRIDDGSRDALDGGFAATAVLGQLSSNLSAFRTFEANHLISPRKNDLATLDAERTQFLTQMTKNIRQYESLDSSDEQKRLFMKFLSNWYAYARQSRTVFAFLSARETNEALAAFVDNRASFDEGRSAIDELIRISIEHGRVIHEDLHDIYRSSVWFLLIATAAISLLIACMLIAVAWHDEK
jgi:methyl-accepting chemotaxis protein